MIRHWLPLLQRQHGAAVSMLERCIAACPDTLWSDRTARPEFWYTAYHTIFFLDCYSADSADAYIPPPPFSRDELDERGIRPDRVYTREELLHYLAHADRNARARINALVDDDLHRRCGASWLDLSVMELVLYSMRHVQHHAGQLAVLLRNAGVEPPRWVRAAPIEPDDPASA